MNNRAADNNTPRGSTTLEETDSLIRRIDELLGEPSLLRSDSKEFLSISTDLSLWDAVINYFGLDVDSEGNTFEK